jgi:hypothetical protein
VTDLLHFFVDGTLLLFVVLAQAVSSHYEARAKRAERECDLWRRLASGGDQTPQRAKLGHPTEWLQ